MTGVSAGEPMHVISLGAGVQSTALLLMAMAGEITPMPDCAIFSDTQWEPKAVYDHLAWLESISTIPIHRVTGGDIRNDSLVGDRFATMPLYVERGGKASMLRRQCTKQYKIRPIQRLIRELSPKDQVTLWLGISTDESLRMRDSRVQYIQHRYPLIDAGVSRTDCVTWLADHGYPVAPRSACIGCPFRRADEWRSLSDTEMKDAIDFDSSIRTLPRIKGNAYLHQSLKPLNVVDFRSEQEKGQLSIWESECEGHCGL